MLENQRGHINSSSARASSGLISEAQSLRFLPQLPRESTAKSPDVQRFHLVTETLTTETRDMERSNNSSWKAPSFSEAKLDGGQPGNALPWLSFPIFSIITSNRTRKHCCILILNNCSHVFPCAYHRNCNR